MSRGSTYGSGTTGLSFSYAYDTFGRVRHVSESGEGAGEARWYGYDADGRLVSVCATATCSDGDGSTEREHYAYDANGNRTSWSHGAGSYTVPSSGGVDAQDRLLRFDLSGGGSVAYAYDNHGRTATRVRRDASEAITESTTLVYDSDGALRSFTRTGAEAVSVTYEQDAVGRRIARRVGGSVTARWLYRGIHPVAEYDDAWVLQRVFVYATRGHVPDYVLAREGSAWVPYRVVTDHLGSVRRVVRVSDGAVVQRMRYDAYGRVLDDVIDEAWSALPFGYAGGLYDRDTGLVRFGARDYDAEIGRWTAKDPIGFSGGDSNVYVYVGNDPQERHDPSGLFGVNELASYLPGINLFAAGVRERANGIFEMGSEATVERGACRAQHGAAMIGLGAGATGMFAMMTVGLASGIVGGGGGGIWRPGTPGLPRIRGVIKSYRNQNNVGIYREAMESGSFAYSEQRGIIRAVIDPQGTLHVLEGNHRVGAAAEIIRDTGNVEPMLSLLENAQLSQGMSPYSSQVLPGRTFAQYLWNWWHL